MFVNVFSLIALERAEAIARQADIVAAFTLDVLKGTTRAFDSCKSIIDGLISYYKRDCSVYYLKKATEFSDTLPNNENKKNPLFIQLTYTSCIHCLNGELF